MSEGVEAFDLRQWKTDAQYYLGKWHEVRDRLKRMVKRNQQLRTEKRDLIKDNAQLRELLTNLRDCDICDGVGYLFPYPRAYDNEAYDCECRVKAREYMEGSAPNAFSALPKKSA